VGIHWDAPVDSQNDAEGYFSIIVCMNTKWKPSWGGDLLFYESSEEADEHHWNRGYGIGYASEVEPHKPGNVIIFPAATLHKSASDKYIPQRGDYLRRIMFRARYIDADKPHLDER